MDKLKLQALENIKTFVNSTSKETLLAKLKAHSGTEGIKISTLINDNFDVNEFYQIVICDNSKTIITEKFDIKNEIINSILVEPIPPDYSYSVPNSKNPHQNAGFSFIFTIWKN